MYFAKYVSYDAERNVTFYWKCKILGGRILCVLNANQVGVKYTYQFLFRCPFSRIQLERASVRTRVQTSTEIHGLSKRELLGPAANLVAVH